MFWNKNNINDDELRQAEEELRRGSAEAFRVLYGKYSQKVYRYCLRMLGSEDAAKDAFQEVFIKIYEHRTEFRGNSFAAWLFTIARHTCLNILKSRREYEQLDDAFNIASNETIGDVAMKDLIQKALKTLPLPLREAIILREYEDCSYQDISDILGIPLSLAKIRVFRAREILRKLLTPIKQELYES